MNRIEEKHWQQDNPAHIYIHIPYCIKKCPYCDFTSVALAEADVTVSYYFNLLYQEIEQALDEASDTEVLSIYFGGGTPSLVDAQYIIGVLERIRARRVLSSQCEITLEMNPGTLDVRNLEALFSAGVNRLSIGLQSTHEKHLASLGRVHTLEDFQYAYHEVRRIGFRNVSVDLILATPNQSMEDLEADLAYILSLGPEHVSIYSLIIEEGTPFGDKYTEGEYPLPSPEIERKMYHLVIDTLTRNGFDHYEISNFSKPGYYSRHNLSYWLGKAYYGFGMGASSYVNGQRRMNGETFQTYEEQITSGHLGLLTETINKIEAIKEFFILRLRILTGFRLCEYRALFQEDISTEHRSLLDRFIKEGYLMVDGDRYFYSRKGLDFADYVARAFI